MMAAAYREGMVWDSYSRISDDPLDTERGVTRQRADNKKAIAARSGQLGVEHNENDTSAYRKQQVERTDALGNRYKAWRVIRPVWHEALHRLREGQADGLMVWDLDRLARDMRDLEDAIEVVTYFGKRIDSPIPGQIDLTTDSGIAMARVLVAMNAKSSADTARRVTRAARETAESGKAVGWRAFGWAEDKVTLDPRESRLAREAIEDLLSGARSIGTIVREWNEAGVTTARGVPWKNTTLRQYLKNPRLAGLRTYRREILHGEDGRPVAGAWEPLVDLETWERLAAVMSPGVDGRGRTPHKNARHYLLTGVLRCGVCNGLMYGNVDKRRGKHYYRCTEIRSGKRKHTNSIGGPQLDSAVEKLVLAYAADVRGSSTANQEWVGYAELEAVSERMAELMDAFSAGQLSGTIVFPEVAKLEGRAAVLNAERTTWLAATAGPKVEDIGEKWNDPSTTLDWRRTVIERVFSAVLVRPRSGGGNVFGYERIVPIPRDL